MALVFPEDLTSSQYNHWMSITAFTRSNDNSAVSGDPITGQVLGGLNAATGAFIPDALQNILPGTTGYNNRVGSVAIFIPGGDVNSGLAYTDQHEYQDIRLSNIPGGILGGSAGGIGAIVPAMAGRVINPAVQVLFRTTKLRQFDFSFLMSPKSERESKNIEEIIKFLRSNAAAEVSANRLIYRTPAEFEIQFHKGGSVNPHVPKIDRCVLENITVYYTPQGEWSTFRNGYPVTVFLQLTFREMRIMTKDKIEAGY
jgi:hypothetical protein